MVQLQVHPLLITSVLPLLQMWSLPHHPLHPQYVAQLEELTALEPSDQVGAAARLLDLGLVAALQQRLRVFGRAPLPCLIAPSTEATPSRTAEVEAFCTAMTETIGAFCKVLHAVGNSAHHQSCLIQAIRQLLSDRFSLVAVVERGLALAVHQAAALSSRAAARCVDTVRAMFVISSCVFHQDKQCNTALARRLQQQLTTFLNLDAIRPNLEVLCLAPGSTPPPLPPRMCPSYKPASLYKDYQPLLRVDSLSMALGLSVTYP
jgi:hypothetical protein